MSGTPGRPLSAELSEQLLSVAVDILADEGPPPRAGGGGGGAGGGGAPRHEEELRAGLEAALVRPLAAAVQTIGAREAERGQEVPAARLALLSSVIEAFWWQRYTSAHGPMSREEVEHVLDDVLLPVVAPDEECAPV